MYNKIKKFLIEILGTLVGAFIIAASISLFLLPNELSSGGFTGIATIFYYILNIPVGATMLVLNIPVFLFAWFKMGKKFLIKSIIGTVSLSFFTDFLEQFGSLTTDKALACVYGGILIGIGTAIVLKSYSSTGGTDLLSLLIKKYMPNVETGRIITIIDGVVVLLNVIFLKNIEIGLYSAIAIYLMGLIVDIMVEGIFFTKFMFIISDKSDEIAEAIETEVNRGVTGLYGKGMYTDKEKLVLACAVGRRDISRVKNVIKSIDKKAFVIVTNSREVLGDGFKR